MFSFINTYNMTIVVIGAGVAGLYVAREITAKTKDRVILIEANPQVGGRISTERDPKTNRILLERGPWRIAQTHTRVIKLCKQLGIQLHRSTKPLKAPLFPETIPGLSVWDCKMRETLDPNEADKFDRATAYPDETRAASGSSPYVTHSKQYFVATEGLDTITNALQTQFQANGGEVLLNTRVTDVVRQKSHFTLSLLSRKGHNDFDSVKINAQTVVVCTPPRAWQDWAIAKYCRTMLDAVDTESLYHVYTNANDTLQSHTLTKAGQQIPSQYANEWSQVVYSSGRLADFWYRMRLSRPAEYAKLLGYPLRNLKSYYWQYAFHMWRPVVGFDLEHAVKLSVEPNPSKLPGLYFANESHSSHQAWIEGALEMAERVIHRMINNERPSYPKRLPKAWVILEGWVIDVSRWKNVHPGSAAALENHLKEHIDILFDHIGHSHVARATAHSLKHSPYLK
jgi:hypothetical protein